ncbi:MAG: hypothetical protein V2B15_08775 [Bacteroidota bacterium]
MEPIATKTSIPVIGLIYAHSKREYIELDSLEDLYWYIMDTYAFVEAGIPVQVDKLPYYIVLEDGSVVTYIHELFHRAFIMKSFSEPELREALELSGV